MSGLRRDAGDEVDARVEALRDALADDVTAVETHPVFDLLDDPSSLRVFMEHHVFAVWDFMNLAKWVQRFATGTTLPWVPTGDPRLRRFANELILEEESDVHPNGEGFTSHFELYLTAMEEMGASTKAISIAVERVLAGDPFPDAVAGCGASDAAVTFTRATWQLIEAGRPEEVVASFALGREALIPLMFERALPRLDGAGPSLLGEYLQRHIVLDGGSHHLMALELLSGVCGDDDDAYARAEAAARQSLRERVALWDGVVACCAEAELQPSTS